MPRLCYTFGIVAFIRLVDNKCRTVNHEQGVAMFMVSQGLMQGTPQQEAYAKLIQRVYLPWDTAPSEYKAKYPRNPGDKAIVRDWTKKYD